jgi:predicted RecA/RadA family phage recombinase
MSRTFVQEGNTIDAIASSGGVTSGSVQIVGAFVGIAEVDAAEGETYALTLVGCHRLPKAAGALNAGALAYWVDSPGNVAGSGDTLLGAVVEYAASTDTSVIVRLNGTVAAGT